MSCLFDILLRLHRAALYEYPSLILRRLLDMIDDEDFHRAFC